jgi:UDP-glucose 6-dehydrogenase
MKISIVGCGWLGLPLGAKLVKNGHRVFGSTTSEEKIEEIKAAGIAPYLLKTLTSFFKPIY